MPHYTSNKAVEQQSFSFSVKRPQEVLKMFPKRRSPAYHEQLMAEVLNSLKWSIYFGTFLTTSSGLSTEKEEFCCLSAVFLV
jgi:hypothetical protein